MSDALRTSTSSISGGQSCPVFEDVDTVDAVDAIQTRLAADGLATIDERGTTCCYAKQDKFWVEGTPNGKAWEVYTVLADSTTFRAADDGAADDGAADDGAACC